MVDDCIQKICEAISGAPSLESQVCLLNKVRRALHKVSPFRGEPVDLVEWVPADTVVANDYNPNKVAHPEMELLYTSISLDGVTQGIVVGPGEEQPQISEIYEPQREIVDGFHRHLICTDREDIRERLLGYLPVSTIDKPRAGRMAATVRHNRARGKHQIDLQAALVRSLLAHGFDDEAISNQLGMTVEELLRLKQVIGVARLMAAEEYGEFYGRDDEPELPPEEEP